MIVEALQQALDINGEGENAELTPVTLYSGF
jgi:hypothetical protein